MKPILSAAAIVIVCSAFGPALGAQSGEAFKAKLTTVPVDFVTAAKVSGSGSAKATLAGDTLTVSGTFEGMGGPATTAHLHLGPGMAIRGPAVFDLTVSKSTSGTVSGAVKLAREQVAALKAGRLYVQINSEPAPDGNVWGWLLPEAPQR